MSEKTDRERIEAIEKKLQHWEDTARKIDNPVVRALFLIFVPPKPVRCHAASRIHDKNPSVRCKLLDGHNGPHQFQ